MNNSLIIREEQTLIEKNFPGSVTYETVYLNADLDVSDSFLNDITNDLINQNEYTNIFIPLCFGPIMSDFNGLRLATHLRCTPGINQNKNIYIFSFVTIDHLINHECFNILKTKGVQLIKYNFHIIQSSIENAEVELALIDVPIELKKLNLQVPANYEDNHSIANEWAIYRWSEAINANDDGINKIKDIQKSNLYFKYLKTIYPISHLDKLTSAQLKINYHNNSKILYIDDEAEKGWKEIFYKIIIDENEYDFIHLDNEFNEKSKDEITDIALQTIIDEDIDLVILDFRLHKEDFETRNIKEITGYQILEKIKQYNKGIQVIIFSATNKIWNLQALKAIGADGFIVKESPENSIDPQFTKQGIKNLISVTEECLTRTFLKYFFNTCEKIKTNILTPYSDPKSPFDDFKKELLVSLKMIGESAKNIDSRIPSSIDVAFLNCYNFLEKFKHFYVKEIKYNIVLGFEEVEMNRYRFENGVLSSEKFIRINKNDNPSFFHTIIALLNDYFKVEDADKKIANKVYRIKESRNNYVHSDKNKFEISELVDIIGLCENLTSNLKD